MRIRKVMHRTFHHSGLARLLAGQWSGLLILAYHRVGSAEPGIFLEGKVGRTDLRLFKEHVRFVKKAGFEFEFIEKAIEIWLDGGYDGRRIAAITFDDGFKDLKINVLPWLSDEKIPASLFLTPSMVDAEELIWLHRIYYLRALHGTAIVNSALAGTRDANLSKYSAESLVSVFDMVSIKKLVNYLSDRFPPNSDSEKEICHSLYLSGNDLDELIAGGIEIQDHTMNHYPLAKLSSYELEKELEASVEWFRKRLGFTPRVLCYPFGSYSTSIGAILENRRFIGACAVGNGINTDRGRSKYELRRFSVEQESTACFSYSIFVRNHPLMKAFTGFRG